MIREDPRAKFYEKRKRRRRKIVIRRIFLMLLTVALTASLIATVVSLIGYFTSSGRDNGFVPWPYGTNISKNVKIAKETEIPEWIDIELIHKHSTARTGRYLSDIKNIVIHYVGNPGTSAINNRNYFDKSTTSVSSHFVVGLEGEIIQCVPIYERSAASNNRNKDSISIEVCHPDETGKFNDETYQALIKLVSWLCDKFSLDESDVIRHYDITEKICPKFYVENEDAWETLKRNVKESLDENKD